MFPLLSRSLRRSMMAWSRSSYANQPRHNGFTMRRRLSSSHLQAVHPRYRRASASSHAIGSRGILGGCLPEVHDFLSEALNRDFTVTFFDLYPDCTSAELLGGYQCGTGPHKWIEDGLGAGH